ncbi:MAG TPA: MlaD family protein [Marmoricola sp.]|nr:MlaD family protein [Marmoricola sp.]
MSLLDKRTSVDLVKLLIFILVTSLATGVLVVLIGNLSFTSSRDYKAVFSDSSGLVNGSEVRIAGVRVGTVNDIQVIDRTRALVSFTVADNAVVTRSSEATIRYRDLVGGRYISISQGVGNTSRLPEGATIPIQRTQPALDLTVLFNGFKPLFAALTPSDVNKLSYEIVQVFQGEGSNLEGLLQNTASVTSTLADRDQVIGQMIDNLNAVLRTIGRRDQQLSSLIVQFRSFMHGLMTDRQAILGSLNQISDLTQQTADLATGIRPSFVEDVKQLRRTAGNIRRGRGELDRALQILPIKLTKIGRTAIYGSFFNFYLCQFTGRVTLPTGQTLPVNYDTGGGRCNLG